MALSARWTSSSPGPPRLGPRRGLRRGCVDRRSGRSPRAPLAGRRIDLQDPKLAAEWATRRAPESRVSRDGGRVPAVCRWRIRSGGGDRGARARGTIPRPPWRRWRAWQPVPLLVSVPHEPLWRALNVARGAYLRELGNTPGHLNHWTRRGFVTLLARHGEVVEIRSPFPWTMLLVALA